MIQIYWIDTDLLIEENIFAHAYEQMSSDRKQKIDSKKSAEVKRLSLGAGIVLQKALVNNGIDYQSAQFLIKEHGKPELSGHPGLYFNLSHSGHIAVCAISDAPIGVDVEWIRDKKISDGLIKKVCADQEISHFFDEHGKRILSEQTVKSFYRLWTIKESIMKQDGRGLLMEPCSIDTSEYFLEDSFWYNNLAIRVFGIAEHYITVCSPEMMAEEPICINL